MNTITLTQVGKAVGEIYAADTRPGRYYVTAVDGDRVAWLSGPHPTHNEALALVGDVRLVAEQIDGRISFAAVGTARIDPASDFYPRVKLAEILASRANQTTPKGV